MLANPHFNLPKSNGFSRTKEGSVKDEVLWNSFKKGNELALSLLYKKYVQRLYDYGMNTSKNHNMVLDCLQELFLRLWNKRETISEIQAVRPYLYKSFRRLLIHQIVEQRKLLTFLAEQATAFEFTLSIESTLIEDEWKAERIKKLKACVQSLTKGQREVIYLKFFNELSYREIAEITEMQVDSVYNLVSKAIELLRKKLQDAQPVISLH
jgi:RNA polymerase sigma factor (sigma-70 family)